MASRMVELALAGLLGGAVGGGIVHALREPAPDVQAAPDGATADATSEPATAAEDGPATPPTDTPPTDDPRLRALERKVALLERVIAKRRAAAEGSADPDSAAPPPADPDDPEFELAVRGVIDKAMDERDEAREQARLDRREQRVLARVDELADKLGLDDKQLEKLEAALLDQMEIFSALRNSEDRPTTRREWRDKSDAIHAQTATKLAEFLSDEQLAGYKDYMAEERGNRRARGRR